MTERSEMGLYEVPMFMSLTCSVVVLGVFYCLLNLSCCESDVI